MQVVSPPAPSAAERIRSVCVRASGALLAVDGYPAVETGVHHLLHDGAFVVTAAADSEMTAAVERAAGVEAVLELTDHAPLPLRSPVRSLVWIRGPVRLVPAPLVPVMLDVIAMDDPNPSLLQVNSVCCGEVQLSLMWLQTEPGPDSPAGSRPLRIASAGGAS
jgi:hypothetical protein